MFRFSREVVVPRTTSLAAALVPDPEELLTATVYDPASPGTSPEMTRMEDVAPEILVSLESVLLSFIHW